MSKICFFISLFIGFVAAGSTAAVSAEPNSDINTACRIPFETLKDSKTGEVFPRSAASNENAKLSENLRQRYIVADLNTTDASGNCRGVQEYFSSVDGLSDFPRLRAIAAARRTDLAALARETPQRLRASEPSPGDAAGLETELEDLQNYLAQVDRFKTEPVVKPPVFNGYCIGQTLNFCELVNGEPKLVYRFVTSSSRTPPPLNRYYAPINVINNRNWSLDRDYTPSDVHRDARMGGGSDRIVPFHNGGNPIPMPNFMHFLPAPGYVGEAGNGIHEIAGGLDSGGTFGAPVSLGCIRLNKFQAKLARWWTPRQAKFFVYFEPDRYRHFGDPATGRARAQAPAVTSSNEVPVEDWPFNTGNMGPPSRAPMPSLPFFWLFSERR